MSGLEGRPLEGIKAMRVVLSPRRLEAGYYVPKLDCLGKASIGVRGHPKPSPWQRCPPGQKPRARDNGYLFKMDPRDPSLLFLPPLTHDRSERS